MTDRKRSKKDLGEPDADNNNRTKKADKPNKPDEPNAINRLLTSAVTESWSRTLRAILVLLTLAVLAFSTATGVAVVGPSIASSLHGLAGGP